MSKYSDFIAEAKSSKSTNFSKSELTTLATVMFNDNEAEIPVYTKKGDSYTEKTMNPGKALKENFVAPILKGFGVDKDELSRLADVQTSRAGGEALADFALLLVKEYVSKNGLGRHLTLPMTSLTESVQTLSSDIVEEKTGATTMIVRGEDGTYTTVPTGKLVTKKKHERLNAGNKVPAWLVESKPAK